MFQTTKFEKKIFFRGHKNFKKFSRKISKKIQKNLKILKNFKKNFFPYQKLSEENNACLANTDEHYKLK